MKRVVLAALFIATAFGQANAQDPAAGEKVFLVCKACHQVGDNAKEYKITGDTKVEGEVAVGKEVTIEVKETEATKITVK